MDKGTPLRDGLSSQATEPEVSAFQASIPSAWQPIETAPKDGAPFLAWCDAGYGEISGLHKCKGFATVLAGKPDEAADPMRRDGEQGPWYLDGGDYYTCWSRATHWMPLPEPPR